MYRPEVKIPGGDNLFVRQLTQKDLASIRAQHKGNVYNVALLVTSWVTLLGDSPLRQRKSHRVLNKFFNELVGDLFGVLRTFSDLSDRLVKSLVEVDDTVSVTEFISDFKETPVFPEYLAFTRTFDPKLLQYLNSFLLFGSKLYYEDADFDAVALRKWHEVELRLENLVIPENISRALYRVIADCLRDWPPFLTWLPVHGSGRVSETGIWGSNQKNSAFELSPTLAHLLQQEFARIDRRIDSVSPDAEYPKVVHGRLWFSRLKFVPKNWKTTRSICMEPIAYQWAQQSVRLWYEKVLASGPLKRHVTFQDQTNNQDGALFGSEFGLVDTIDLSAASDSVSWDLVLKIFPSRVKKFLHATRTKVVELPDGSYKSVKKFAPMGSALCFPVQSTIYSAIVIVASISLATGCNILEGEYLDEDKLDAWPEYFNQHYGFTSNRFQPFRVYGDDIICDTRVTSLTVQLLRLLGFQVNEGKSFIGRQLYRESCGIHGFQGHDVSPYFFKVKKLGPKTPLATIGGLIDHTNRALDYGYMNLRRHLKNYVLYHPIVNVAMRRGVNPILFVEKSDIDSSYALRVKSPRNSHLKRREYVEGMAPVFKKKKPDSLRHFVTVDFSLESHYAYQRSEIESFSVTTEDEVEFDSCFNNYHFIAWQRSRFSGGIHDDVISSFRRVDAQGMRVARRWTPS